MRSTATPYTDPSLPPQGWRGGVRLALDVLVTGLIVSLVLSLAVVSVAAQAQGPAAGTGFAMPAPVRDWPGLFVAGLAGIVSAAWAVRSRRQRQPAAPPNLAEEALRRRVAVAGWVC